MAQNWAGFTLLKAKKTAQMKPYKTTLHTAALQDLSQTRIPSLQLKTLYFHSALSKFCAALHGSDCFRVGTLAFQASFAVEDAYICSSVVICL